jgi:hypothetical protein
MTCCASTPAPLATSDPLGSDAAVRRLLDYYAHAVQAAGRYIIFWSAARGRPPHGNSPAAAPALTTRQQAVAWLETERPNLRAAVSCAATTGRPLHAVAIAAAMGASCARTVPGIRPPPPTRSRWLQHARTGTGGPRPVLFRS